MLILAHGTDRVFWWTNEKNPKAISALSVFLIGVSVEIGILMWDSKAAESKALIEAQTIYYVPSFSKSKRNFSKEAGTAQNDFGPLDLYPSQHSSLHHTCCSLQKNHSTYEYLSSLMILCRPWTLEDTAVEILAMFCCFPTIQQSLEQTTAHGLHVDSKREAVVIAGYDKDRIGSSCHSQTLNSLVITYIFIGHLLSTAIPFLSIK